METPATELDNLPDALLTLIATAVGTQERCVPRCLALAHTALFTVSCNGTSTAQSSASTAD